MVLADTSIRRPVFTTMVILAIVVFGWIAYNKIGIDLFPNIEFPIITVTTVYPGADPETVETKVSRKIEDAVNQVSLIKMVRSVSLQSVSQVVIQFEMEKKIDVAAQEIRDNITTIMRDLPTDIEQPLVRKVDLGAMPIFTLAVSGDASVPEASLFRFADRVVKQQIQKIQGVGNVNIVGGRDRVIWVYIDPQKLISRHLTPDDVVRTLGAQNLDIPAGNMPVAGREIAVKTKGAVDSIEELRNLSMTSMDGAIVRLRDVASVEDGLEEEKSKAIFGAKKTLTVVITKQPGTNTVEMARRIRGELSAIEALCPAGIEVKTMVDNAEFIETSVHEAIIDLELGGLLAVLIIGIFLRNLRMTLIAGIAIPTSVIGTFAAMRFFDFTLNFLTLNALSLSVGLLVDDAIVVLENIFRHFEDSGDRRKAAHDATDEIGLAVMAITFSLVAVFFPIATTSGMVARFLKQFGITVSIAVLLSLFVSFTLTPMLSSRIIKRPADNLFTRGVEATLKWLDRGYGAIIRWALGHRAVVLSIAVATLALTVFLAARLPKEMIPQADQGEFNVNIQSPPGASIEYTQGCVNDVMASLAGRDDVAYTLGLIASGMTEKKEEGRVYVKLVEREKRALGQSDVMVQVRERFKDYDRAEMSVEGAMPIDVGMAASIIQLNVLGDDLETLDSVAQKIAGKMKKAGGYTDVSVSFKPSKPELDVLVDRERAAAAGVPAALVGSTIRILLAGVKASEYKEGGDMYDVLVRLDEKDRRNLDAAKRLSVRAPSGISVELANLVKTASSSMPQDITRISGQRAVSIFSNLSHEKALGTAVDELKVFVKAELPKGYGYKFVGQADFMKENFEQLFRALILGIIMIYFILASQFESFLHPFTIMLALPFSIVGAISALMLSGNNLSMLTMIGFIMLMGLVTKNSVLLVDFAIKGKDRGMPLNDAIVRAGTIRLRPILMTTFAMIAGMVPIAAGMSRGAEIRSPMAVAVIGGLITSTFLTLVVVPVMFNLVEKLKEKTSAAIGH